MQIVIVRTERMCCSHSLSFLHFLSCSSSFFLLLIIPVRVRRLRGRLSARASFVSSQRPRARHRTPRAEARAAPINAQPAAGRGDHGQGQKTDDAAAAMAAGKISARRRSWLWFRRSLFPLIFTHSVIVNLGFACLCVLICRRWTTFVLCVARWPTNTQRD